MEVGSSSLPGTTSDSRESKCSGGLAQLARAPALQAGGQRFESVILHVSHLILDIAFGLGNHKVQSSKFKVQR